MPVSPRKLRVLAPSGSAAGRDTPGAVIARPADNRDVALDNETSVLKCVRWYGHLRRVEIARAVWSSSSHTVAMKMAQRTVARLIRSGDLLERMNLLNGRSLVLSRRGAARLAECDLPAHDGYDLSSVSGPHFIHRTIGSRYLIERAAQGDEVFSEHALLKDWGPLERRQFGKRFGKIPDGLVLSHGQQRGMDAHLYAADWIEVESSYKPRRKLAQIFAIALERIPAMKPTGDLILDRVLFVYDRRHRHERRIIQALQRYVAEHPLLDRTHLSNIVLVRCRIDTPLVWRQHEEIDCGQVMRPPDVDAPPAL